MQLNSVYACHRVQLEDSHFEATVIRQGQTEAEAR